jgi:hypothetical protein
MSLENRITKLECLLSELLSHLNLEYQSEDSKDDALQELELNPSIPSSVMHQQSSSSQMRTGATSLSLTATTPGYPIQTMDIQQQELTTSALDKDLALQSSRLLRTMVSGVSRTHSSQ